MTAITEKQWKKNNEQLIQCSIIGVSENSPQYWYSVAVLMAIASDTVASHVVCHWKHMRLHPAAVAHPSLSQMQIVYEEAYIDATNALMYWQNIKYGNGQSI